MRAHAASPTELSAPFEVLRDPAGAATPLSAYGALCLHGLTSTPYEVRPVAAALAEAGLGVFTPRLIGHGRRAELLSHCRWPDWMATARRGFERLAERHERVFIVGASMGALIGLVLAHEHGARVAGIVAMSTPLRLAIGAQAVLETAHRIPLASVWPYLRKTQGPDVSDSAVAASMPGYARIPLAAAATLIEGQAEAAARIPRLSVPVLVQHGRGDHTAPISNAHVLYRRLRTPDRTLRIYPRSWHILPLDVEHEQVIEDVLAFVRAHAGSSEAEAT